MLRTIRDAVQRGNFAPALSQIDRALAANSDPAYKAKLLVQSGDCLFKQGKFAEAAETYGKISRMVQDNPVDWLTPTLAQIRSFLKAAQIEQAADLAIEMVKTAVGCQQDYQTFLSHAA